MPTTVGIRAWLRTLFRLVDSGPGNYNARPPGISVDRALGRARFRSVPTALEWAEKSKFTRNLKVLREWKDARTFYFEGPAGTGTLPSRDR